MAALRAAVFPLSAKTRRGGHFLPPPSSVRVNPRNHRITTTGGVVMQPPSGFSGISFSFTDRMSPFFLIAYRPSFLRSP